MTPSPTYTWSLTVGDPNLDDHGKSVTQLFTSNRTLAQVDASYTMAVKMYGIDLLTECDDFEICTLSQEFYDAIVSVFQDDASMTSWLTDSRNFSWEDEFELDDEGFMKLFLKLAQRMDAELTWAESTDNNNLFIGGHGLFTKD